MSNNKNRKEQKIQPCNPVGLSGKRLVFKLGDVLRVMKGNIGRIPRENATEKFITFSFPYRDMKGRGYTQTVRYSTRYWMPDGIDETNADEFGLFLSLTSQNQSGRLLYWRFDLVSRTENKRTGAVTFPMMSSKRLNATRTDMERKVIEWNQSKQGERNNTTCGKSAHDGIPSCSDSGTIDGNKTSPNANMASTMSQMPVMIDGIATGIVTNTSMSVEGLKSPTHVTTIPPFLMRQQAMDGSSLEHARLVSALDGGLTDGSSKWLDDVISGDTKESPSKNDGNEKDNVPMGRAEVLVPIGRFYDLVRDALERGDISYATGDQRNTGTKKYLRDFVLNVSARGMSSTLSLEYALELLKLGDIIPNDAYGDRLAFAVIETAENVDSTNHKRQDIWRLVYGGSMDMVTGAYHTLDIANTDHYMPRNKGGITRLSNMQLMRARRNMLKGSEVRDPLAREPEASELALRYACKCVMRQCRAPDRDATRNALLCDVFGTLYYELYATDEEEQTIADMAFNV